MSEAENVRVVQEIYAAFSRGDIPGVLARMTGDVELHYPGPSEIPYAGVYKGQDGLVQFFSKVGENAEVLELVADEYVAQGDTVVALGRERTRSRPTGKEWQDAWAMVWTLRDGKVTRVRIFHETAAIAATFRG